MNTTKVSVSVGPGFFALLTLLFIGLKLGGVIDWSWLWVLSPLWIPTALCIAVLVLVCLGIVISDLLKTKRVRNKYERRNKV